jgi:serine O-acetyltransferase
VRHPHLARNVIVGSNACVLGAIHVGEGARIGSGSVVIADVPAGATVVGVPGRVVKAKTPSDVLDHAALPDPVSDVLRALANQQEALVERLARLERRYRNEEEAEALEAREDDPRHRAGRIF